MKKTTLFCLVLLLLCMTGCHFKQKNGDGDQRGIYYWKTTFALDEYERNFLKQHQINKLYVRFFDIEHSDWEEETSPCATLVFLDSVPSDIEIVPTIFIPANAIEPCIEYQKRILQRISAMADVNGVKFNEIQIDCDWDSASSTSYFQFMEEFHKLLKKNDIQLSTTVRFSQLGMKKPSADYGVLMCYNTGNFSDWETENSILDIEQIKPYLPKLKDFGLPLSIALPQYSWNIIFDKRKEFGQIENEERDFSDSKIYKKIATNRYALPNDKYIRHEECEAKTLLKAKSLIIDNMRNKPKGIVLYHLDSDKLSKFSSNDVEKIYR